MSDEQLGYSIQQPIHINSHLRYVIYVMALDVCRFVPQASWVVERVLLVSGISGELF
jgi:hypothetical protein